MKNGSTRNRTKRPANPSGTINSLLENKRQIPQAQAAEFLGISERKMEKMRREGDGPKFVRLSSKLVRYRVCDLIEFQEQHLQANNAGLSAA